VKKWLAHITFLLLVALFTITDPMHVGNWGYIHPVQAQDKTKDKDVQIRELQFKIENFEIEADFHELSAQQQNAQNQIDKLTTQLNGQLVPYQTKLTTAMDKARKDQGIADNFSYNVNTHKWEPPLPQKAPDGSPVKPTVNPEHKPVTKPETKK
jgi:hypothetical protein